MQTAKTWLDWADDQADLRVHWMHRSFYWFCHAPAQLPHEVNNELQHDKTNKVSVHPAKTQISLGIWTHSERTAKTLIRLSGCPARHIILSRQYMMHLSLNTQRRLWSDWADAQLIWVFAWRTHFVGFVMSLLVSCKHFIFIFKVFHQAYWDLNGFGFLIKFSFHLSQNSNKSL